MLSWVISHHPFSFPWCTARIWNGEASLYWLMKTLQRSSQSSWPCYNVRSRRARHRERKAVSGHTSGKDLLLPMALVATSSKHSRAFLSGCFSAHIYLPAQNATENQSNVYVCVHTSVKWSNNNSVTAAVVSTFFFCYCINISCQRVQFHCKLYRLDCSVLSTSKCVNDTKWLMNNCVVLLKFVLM